MEGSVLSFLKAEWKVSNTDSLSGSSFYPLQLLCKLLYFDGMKYKENPQEALGHLSFNFSGIHIIDFIRSNI